MRRLIKCLFTIRMIFVPTVLSLLSACNTIGYYAQSVEGQMEMLNKRQPIEQLLADSGTPKPLQLKLSRVLRMRDFAIQELKLPDNDSYRSYADLGRPYVVWNVFAAPPLALELQKWCFPFAGCVAYRGYFAESDAQAYATELTAKGLDTYVGGVAAYSTLGWFDDPVLNTFVGRSEAHIAGLIFHELSHQRLYVKGDTAFNEAFATTVELEGVRRWLAREGNAEQAEAYAVYRQRQKAFIVLVSGARDQLKNIYQQTLTDPEKINRKLVVIKNLRRQYVKLKQQWNDYSGYDKWFERDVNNAQLGAVATYQDHVPALQRLLKKQAGDLAAFYRACDVLAAMTIEERQLALYK